jgi:chorismate--pyruvate lyase
VSFNASFPVGLAVNWQRPEDISVSDAYLKNWLLDTGSLTERVQSLCHRFSLQVLGQAVGNPHDNELSLLTGNGDVPYHVREILLCGNDEAWVFARSIIPQTIIDAELSNLGSEPLGKRLFNDSRFRRSNFDVCTLHASQLGYQQAQTLWGRRSVFTLEGQSMIVAEVFLPQSPAYTHVFTNESLV